MCCKCYDATCERVASFSFCLKFDNKQKFKKQ